MCAILRSVRGNALWSALYARHFAHHQHATLLGGAREAFRACAAREAALCALHVTVDSQPRATRRTCDVRFAESVTVVLLGAAGVGKTGKLFWNIFFQD